MKSSVLACAATLFLSSVCAQTAPAAAPGANEAAPVFGLRLGQDRLSDVGTRLRNPKRESLCPPWYGASESAKSMCMGSLYLNAAFDVVHNGTVIRLGVSDPSGHTPKAYKLVKVRLALEGQNVQTLFHDDVLIELSPLDNTGDFRQTDFSKEPDALIAALDAKYRKVEAKPYTVVGPYSKRDSVRHSWLDASGQVQLVFDVSTTTVTNAAMCIENVRTDNTTSARVAAEVAFCRLTVPYPNPAHLYYRHVPLYERAMEAAVKLNSELKAGKAASDAANLKRF